MYANRSALNRLTKGLTDPQAANDARMRLDQMRDGKLLPKKCLITEHLLLTIKTIVTIRPGSVEITSRKHRKKKPLMVT